MKFELIVLLIWILMVGFQSLLIKYNYTLILSRNLCLTSTPYVVVCRAIKKRRFLANTWKFEIIHICYGYHENLGDVKCSDWLRDCRKSPKLAILVFSHVMKSTTYKHQIPSFRVFRQSQQKHEISPKLLGWWYRNFFGTLKSGNMEIAQYYKTVLNCNGSKKVTAPTLRAANDKLDISPNFLKSVCLISTPHW